MSRDILTEWAHCMMTADTKRRLDKAAAHVGVSNSELIRMSVRYYLQQHALWSLRGPNKSVERVSRPRKANKHALREEVETHDE